MAHDGACTGLGDGHRLLDADDLEGLGVLWAKSAGAGGRHHPLFCHALDTAAVTTSLWRRVLPPAVCGQCLSLAGTEDGAALGAWLAFLASLHDVGKATPGFQGSCRGMRPRLTALGFSLPLAARTDHDRLTLRLLPEMLAVLGEPCRDLSPLAARALAWAVAGHHSPALPPAGPKLSLARDVGEGRWETARAALVRVLGQVTAVPPHPPGLVAAEPDLLAILSGLTQLCDWMASTPAWFPPVGNVGDWRAYWRQANARAAGVVASVAGLAPPWPPRGTENESGAGSLLAYLSTLGVAVLALDRECGDGVPRRLAQAWGRSHEARQRAARAPQPWLIAHASVTVSSQGGQR